MKITRSKLKGLVLIEPNVFGDSRGFFMELWNEERFSEAGLNMEFRQDNLSLSEKGVLRGLHYQNPNSQGKFVSVLEGSVYDVAVDIRQGSPTYGQWEGYTLDSEKKSQLYVPPGFAHGFVVTSEKALFCYKCTEVYHPEHEATVLWNDPDLGIDWPIENPNLSQKDLEGKPLKDQPEEKYFYYDS